jgi:hypothetical protein
MASGKFIRVSLTTHTNRLQKQALCEALRATHLQKQESKKEMKDRPNPECFSPKENYPRLGTLQGYSGV